MKTALLLIAITTTSSAAVYAADAPAAQRGELIRTIARLESAFAPGEVVAVALDDSGDKAPHYHVDMHFPQSGVARLDVDAATGAISGRDRDVIGTGWASITEATAVAGNVIPGQVLAAELDSSDGARAHYDIDVRLPTGYIARLKLDPVTRQVDWRMPAVVAQ